MIELIRANSNHTDFIDLVQLLDAELAVRDGDEHAFYAQFNKIDEIRHAVVAYENGKPMGCGVIKMYGAGVVEVKRMFVAPEARGRGAATKILLELEEWAKSLSYKKCILETGLKQPEAIALYQKNGYRRIPNYGQYEKVANSVCFEKYL